MATEAEVRTIRGTITRLFHQAPGFCAGRLLPVREDVTRGGEITFAGKVFVSLGESVTLRGSWTDHEKYGRQFQVAERLHTDSLDAAGLAAWLAVHGAARGIGPVKAEKIAREFGENFTGILRDNPEQVAIAASVPLDVVRELREKWLDAEEENTVATRLAAWGLTAHQIKALYGKFKGSIVPLLEADPYLLLGEVDGLGFARVDELARKLGCPEQHPGRLAAALLHGLRQARDDGSTCLERSVLLDTALEVLGLRQDGAAEMLAATVEELLQGGRRLLHIQDGDRQLYALPACWRHEHGIADFLAAANQPNRLANQLLREPAAPADTFADDTTGEDDADA